MTNGTSQGLFIVVAIVIFGIFVALSYTVFGSDGLSGGISGLFEDSIVMTVDNYKTKGREVNSQEDFTFEIDEISNTATITKYVGSARNVIIPELIVVDEVEYLVTAIGDNAFYGPSGINPAREPIAFEIRSVVIPDSVEIIGSWAFARNNLSSLTLPENLGVLMDGAFGYNSLRSLNMNENLVTIHNQAFRDNNLSNVDFPDSLRTISAHVFRNNNLNSVELHSATSYLDSSRDSPSFDSNVNILTR